MKGKWGYAFLGLAFVSAVAVAPVEAQQGRGFRGQGLRGQGGPNMGHSVALALENQEALGLTGDQVAELQELKAVMDGDVANLTAEIKALREQVRAGEVARDEGARQLQALTGELQTASAPLRGRVQEILTVDQHRKLQPLAWQDRPGAGQARAGVGRIGVGARNPMAGRGLRRSPAGARGAFGPRPGIGRGGRALGPGMGQGMRGYRFDGAARPGPWFRRGGIGSNPPGGQGGVGTS
jgi:hypothetical protein